LELSFATIEDYCNKKYTGKMPPDPAALYQMADGLSYIHSNNLVHRDVSTGNVLIAPNGDQDVLLKISDFGFCKPASDTGSFSMSQGSKGTKRFVAPEMLLLMDVKGDKPRGKASSDIFSMGCLFFTYLTKGRHPFSNGSVHTIPLNIIENKQFLESNLIDSFYSLLFEIVSFNEYILLVNV
jgi:serine/threonine protein kinase